MDGMNVSSEEVFFKIKKEEREVGVKERSRGRVGKSKSCTFSSPIPEVETWQGWETVDRVD